MIAALISGQSCWIVPYSPNTDDPVRLGGTLPADLKRALTGASSRRLQGLTLRSSLEWTSILSAADFAALRNATQAAQDEPILVPLWPHAIRNGIDTATITSGLTIAWTSGWTSWAVNPGSLVGYDYSAPLLYGRFAQPPRETARNDEKVTVEFSFEEDGPSAYAIATVGGLLPADTTMNTPGGPAAPIFPFVPEGGTPPKPGAAVVDVDRQAFGAGRQKATTFYPQSPEQTHEATFKFTTAAGAAKLIAWWARRGGIADAHWVALTQKLGFLSADLAIGATALNFTKPIAPLGGNAFVALFDPAGRLEMKPVQSSTAQSVTLSAGVAQAWMASWTTVVPAMLARHTNTELQINYRRANEGWVATATLQWREVAPEYNPPAGETLGATLGRLPGAAFFYQIDLDYNGAIQSVYLTDYESGAFANGTNWVYNPSDFDSLIQSVDLEDDNCTFKLRWYAGCPWENWQPGQLSARGFLTISRADVDAAGAFSNFRQIWKGELSTPTPDGPNLSVKVLGANAVFGRKTPRQLMGPYCGTNLFKTRCGLSLGDWTFNAVIVAIASNVVTIGTITRAIGGGLPAGFGAVDWFALGWMGWTSGGLPYRDGVLTSAAIDGSGQIVLTLERACTLAVGAAVTVVPGCDRLRPSGCTKFANTDNFRGFDQMPPTSPSFIIPQRQTSTSKK